MQFLTMRQQKTGTERHTRQFGGRGEFFAFDHDLSQDPTIEGIGVRQNLDFEGFGTPTWWPDIEAGAATGREESLRQGTRLCCTSLQIPLIKHHDIDTTSRLVQARLAEFVQAKVIKWAEPVPPLRQEWLTSDVIALARGIHTNSALDGLPMLYDALLEAGCDDPLVMEHLRTCPDHSPSCWVVEMILAGSIARNGG